LLGLAQIEQRRDAAGRGLRVLLVEQSDLASGTSSTSEKSSLDALNNTSERPFKPGKGLPALAPVRTPGSLALEVVKEAAGTGKKNRLAIAAAQSSEAM
jgi:hypothetical protein